MSESSEPTVAEMIRAAVEKIKAQNSYEPCYHVVHPPKPGYRWALVNDMAYAETVIRCAALCGWAAYARQVPE